VLVLPELCHISNRLMYTAVCHLFLADVQVFGSAQRLGATANNYTVDGYLQRSAEYTSWTNKGESLAAVEDKLNKLGAEWWQAKLARLPGLQVSGTTLSKLYTAVSLRITSEVYW
jgi:hypothetical protein